jgi:uncharacterized protein
VSPHLLDVNVMVALSWRQHSLHSLARSWFAQHRAKGWATCPLVEAGFVRIVSNPNFSPQSVSVQEAVEALRSSLVDKAHQFWPDSIALPEALGMLDKAVTGHQQITDAYLVALAIKNRGKLATLDRGIAEMAPTGVVEVIE